MYLNSRALLNLKKKIVIIFMMILNATEDVVKPELSY